VTFPIKWRLCVISVMPRSWDFSISSILSH
jgi:hypothetical protein